jgi:hypothetical protein
MNDPDFVKHSALRTECEPDRSSQRYSFVLFYCKVASVAALHSEVPEFMSRLGGAVLSDVICRDFAQSPVTDLGV